MAINLSAFGLEEEPNESGEQVDFRDIARKIVRGRSREEMLALAGAVIGHQAKAPDSTIPHDRDGLWSYIKETWGIELARVAVCPGHDAPFDFVWLGFTEKVPNLFCIGPRGGGKCVVEGTPIYDPRTGLDRPIEEVVVGSLVASMSGSGAIVSSEVSRVFDSGEKECCEIVTASGRRISGSADHPLLTADGWRRIDDLEVGETIAAPVRLPSVGLRRVERADVDLLAILLAEGNYTAPGQVKFTSFDSEIIKIAEAASRCHGGRLVPHARNGSYGLSRSPGSAKRNPFRVMLDSYGIEHEKAPSKVIPDAIMAAPQGSVARFLAIFWMCDGWIGHRGPEMVLASEVMMRQIQRLLLRLGIQSRVSKTSKSYGSDKLFDCWRLVVYGRYVESFQCQIKLWGEKKVKLDEVASKKRNGNAGRPAIPDWLPDLLSAPLGHMSKADRGDRSRAIARDLGWSSSKHTKGLSALTAGGIRTVQIRRLRSLCERTPGIDRDRVAHLLSEDLWWDAIVSIEPIGVRRTFDLTIAETGNFVAGDVLVHNSFDTALLMELNSRDKPGCESIVFGAVDDQNKKVYNDMVNFFINGGMPDGESEIKGNPKITETDYKNGSRVRSYPACLTKNAKVITPEGPVKISTIVSKKLPGPVRSYNFERGTWEWKEVVGWLNRGQDDDWLKLRIDFPTDGNPSVVTCTPEHEMVRPSGEKTSLCLMRPGEEVVVYGQRYSEEQEQILMGLMLGDGNVANQGTLRVTHCLCQRYYLDWIIDAFSETPAHIGHRVAGSLVSASSGGETLTAEFPVTRRTRELRQECYHTGCKRIPDGYWDRLGVLGLAVWLMDDGCFVKRPGKGSVSAYWVIATHQMTSAERAGVDRFFGRLGIHGRWQHVDAEKDQWMWSTASEEAMLGLTTLVAGYIDISERQEKGWKRWIADPISEHSVEAALPARIESMEPIRSEYCRYDITVADNHNYLLSTGLLVGNTFAKMNGQHPPKAHAEEVEIMKAPPFRESRNMASDRITSDGTRIKAQNFGTSTRKWKGGRVDKIYKTFLKAKQKAMEALGVEASAEEIRDHVCLTSPWWVVIYCFAPETRVRTRRGLVPIADVVEGDYVLSRGGEYRRVKKTMRRRHIGEVRVLRTSCGQMIRVTPEHPIAALKDVRDGVVATKPTNRRRDDDFVEEWTQAGALNIGSYVRVEVPREHQYLRYVEPPSWGGRKGNSHDSYALTSEFLWAIGLYIAEGHATHGAIHYSLDRDEVEYERRIRGVFEPLGFTVSRYDSVGSAMSRSTSITVHSAQLAEWWREWIGHGCQNKAIPSEVFSLGDDELAHVLSGVLDGDGSERWNAIGQTSAVLATQIIELNLRRGGRATMNIPRQRLGRKQTYYINNADPEVRIAPGRATSVALQERPRGYWDLNGQRYAKVVQNDVACYDGFVYDLTVEGDPSFVIENMLVHNCLFEIAAPVPNCRAAPENARLPEDQKCKCNIIEHDVWDDGTPRTLESVCRGRLYRSGGHRSYGEVVQLFLQNDRVTWEAQQECIDAEREGLYVPSFMRTRHGLATYAVDPANGPIFTGTDWGFTSEACVLWVQYLTRSMVGVGYDGEPKVLPKGSRVIFSEIYKAGLTATELGKLAIVREVTLAGSISAQRITVRKRFADLAGAGDRKDWRKIGLKTSRYSTRNFEEHVKEVRGLFGASRAFVVVDFDEETGIGCPNYCEEIEAWREENGREVEEANHAMAAGRYVFYGMHDIYQDSGALLPDEVDIADLMKGPGVHKEATAPAARIARRAEIDARAMLDEEDWRAALGVEVDTI